MEEQPLLDSDIKNINLNDLNLSVDVQMEDYVFLAPTPPFRKGYYITNIAGIKFGYGARFYLLKALQKVKEAHPTGLIPVYQIDVAKEPSLEEPIVRRRGQWEPRPAEEPFKMVFEEPFKAVFKEGDTVAISSTFPDSIALYQQDISKIGPEKFEAFIQQVRSKEGIVRERTPIGLGSSKVWVQFTEPIMGLPAFGFEREDLVLPKVHAYKIRDTSNSILSPVVKKKRALTTGGHPEQGYSWEISEGSEDATHIHRLDPTKGPN